MKHGLESTVRIGGNETWIRGDMVGMTRRLAVVIWNGGNDAWISSEIMEL